MESGEARRDTCAERILLRRFVLCGIVWDVTYFGPEAASMPSRPPMQARFFIVFQVTNDKLRHADHATHDTRHGGQAIG
jgi:hypothetical protein